MQKDKDKRLIFIDILNILACIAVITLHHNGIVHTYSPERFWKTSLIFEVLFYWAVPIFLMITGAMLLDYQKKYDTKTYFKKRFIKILIPLISWSIIMLIWKLFTNQIQIEPNFKYIINLFFTNGIEYIYYFMFLIIGIYLTIPVIAKLSEDRKTLWYIVILLFITKSFLPLILKLIGISYNNDLAIGINGYLIFVILGYLIRDMDISKKNRIIIYILGINSCLFRYFWTYFSSTKLGYKDGLLFDYTQFHSVFLAVAVFVLIKQIKWNKYISKKSQRIISKISSCSFGIYLIHIIVMYYERQILDISVYSIWWRTICVILTYIISLLIVYILKKIPLVKRIVP